MPAVSAAQETLERLLAQAHACRASDIHLEPLRQTLQVRLRIDGVLQLWAHLSLSLASALVSTIKLWARLPLDQKRLPLDGRFTWKHQPHKNLCTQHQYRVAVATSPLGESVVLRRIDGHHQVRALPKLGMPQEMAAQLMQALLRADGMVLVSGPTGSGKTTSLYAMLEVLCQHALKIITLEDPVERIVPGVCQVALNPSIGFDIACALKAILRQAPNVIMVGEIRDTQTAQMAMQAALTGHTVLGSIHTQSALAASLRLVNLGVAPAMVAAGLKGVLAQRLVRRLCVHCAQVQPPLSWERAFLSQQCLNTLKHPQGCAHCAHTGYYGRTGVFEWVGAHPELAELFLKHACVATLQERAHTLGFKSMREHGIQKVLQGESSVQEIISHLNDLNPV